MRCFCWGICPNVPKEIGDGPIKMALLQDTQKEKKRKGMRPHLKNYII
jgi:hypothetical protein